MTRRTRTPGWWIVPAALLALILWGAVIWKILQ